MRCRLLAFCLGATIALSTDLLQAQQELYLADFQADLPGPGLPAAMNFEFHGDANLIWAHEIILTDATNQAYHQTADAAGTNPTPGYWFAGGGTGGAVTPGEGQTLATGPGSESADNYRFSADVRFVGATVAAPVGFGVSQFDADYETAFGVDANNDGDMLDGANTFNIEVRAPLVESPDFQTISFFLDAATPTADMGVLPAHIGFNNMNNLSWVFFWGGAEFSLDDGNSVTIDNIRFDFVPPGEQDGDFDGDEDVDGADFLDWQRGESPNPNDPADLAEWIANFGAGGGVPAIGAVPEPAAVWMVLSGAGVAFAGRLRKR